MLNAMLYHINGGNVGKETFSLQIVIEVFHLSWLPICQSYYFIVSEMF